MTATSAPIMARPTPTTRRRMVATARLLRLELRHNAMLWVLPLALGLFWFTSYSKTLAMPPLWYLAATRLQSGVVTSFIVPVVGAAAWMGSREARRRMTDLMTITARSRWARLIVTWAATTIWALVGCGICVAVVYGVTAHQASWGGPLWWPAAVAAASVVVFSTLGFAAGALLPGRFTAPLVAIASFFVLVLSTELITGSQSYWNISPVVTGPWDFGLNPGVATFYPYVPDLAIAQIMFLAGLTAALLGALALPASGRGARSVAASIAVAGLVAAGTSVVLTGAGTMDAHGMIAIPALHDAATDQPIRYTPVCSRTAIPVCVNPAYARYLPAVAATLRPMLAEIAGLPGAPVRISQAAATYQQRSGNDVSVGLTGPQLLRGEYRTLLPDQLNGLDLTISQLAQQVRVSTGTAIVASFVGDGPAASQAQHAVAAALATDAGLPAGISDVGPHIPPGGIVRNSQPGQASGCFGLGCSAGAAGSRDSPVAEASRRFAALPLAARRAWLAQHLTALRAGQITLGELP